MSQGNSGNYKQFKSFDISDDHLSAVNRKRRVALNFDVVLFNPAPNEDPYKLLEERMVFTDDPSTTIDSIWWNWGEGNIVPYKSKRLPSLQHDGYQSWLDQGIDIVKIFLDETHKRGLECFYSHRMNGGDMDPRTVPGVGVIFDNFVHEGQFSSGIEAGPNKIPMKEENPEWLFDLPWAPSKPWNFAIEEVRQFILGNLTEIVEDYNFDGIELDFARGVVFPQGEGWQNRDKLSDFMQQIRQMTLEIEEKRGRPFLVAARVPENLPGCHFDGLDVETWAKNNFVDIFTVGCRSFEVDIQSFQKIVRGKSIKIFPSIDDHHSSDGYCTPPIEVFRGLFSNWYQQGADGIQTFNFAYGPKQALSPVDPWGDIHLQAYKEIANLPQLLYSDKTFVIQRRGGGHGQELIAYPEDWETPRYWYANTNMLAQLPIPLSADDKVDTLLKINIGDDVNTHYEKVNKVQVKVLLHDCNKEYLKIPRMSLPTKETENQIQRVMIREFVIPFRPGKENEIALYNNPVSKDTDKHLQMRINNILSPIPRINSGWFVFDVPPKHFALGENLIGLCLTNKKSNQNIMVEKLEIHISYKK